MADDSRTSPFLKTHTHTHTALNAQKPRAKVEREREREMHRIVKLRRFQSQKQRRVGAWLDRLSGCLARGQHEQPKVTCCVHELSRCTRRERPNAGLTRDRQKEANPTPAQSSPAQSSDSDTF